MENREHKHGNCSCGHEHQHDHDHHESKSANVHSHEQGHKSCACDCGQSEERQSCGCKEEHEHNPEEDDDGPHHHDHEAPKGYEKKTYPLENLSCAHCASKMEEQIAKLPQILNVSVIYTTKQLRITAKDPDALLPKLQNICQEIEPDVRIVTGELKDKKQSKDDHEEHNFLGKFTVPFFIISALIIVAGEIYHESSDTPLPWPLAVIFILLYIAQGYKVLWTAAKNLRRGHIFDENFLMSIATIGAIIIGKYGEAAGVMLFYQIGEYFEHRAVERSRKQIMSAIDMRPEVVLKVSENSNDIQTIPAKDANPGDIVLVRPGDRIPLDGVIVEGESRVDTSPLTGEPVPVRVTAGTGVLSGCVNISGAVKLRVEKALGESMVTRILDSVENAAANKPRLDRFITRFSHYYTPIVIILAILVAIGPPLIAGQPWEPWVYTALTFLVMSCPCALVLSVPLAFFSGIGAGSKKGILFKGGSSLEALSRVQAIVMDKTGTLTKGNFKVSEIVTGSRQSTEELLYAAACCEMTSTHPIGISILEEASAKGLNPKQPEQMEEIAGHGIYAVLGGNTYLCGNQKLMDRYHITIPEMSSSLAATEVYMAVNDQFAGVIRISDTLKPDAKASVSLLKRMGLSTAILTGDAQAAAKAMGEEAGVDEIHAKLLPDDKLNRLAEIRKRRGKVMFVGDGINDAPVLAGADVGAAMGSGADAAIEAADVVFMTSEVKSIVDAIKIARTAYRIAIQNVVVALIIKVIVMVLGFMGIASMWLAVFADTGVAILCILNSIRILYSKKYAPSGTRKVNASHGRATHV